MQTIDRGRASQRVGRPVFRLTAACGATFPDTADDPSHGEGTRRFAVYDSEGGITRPQKDGAPAPCMFGCPRKREAGRKYERCFPSDESEAFKQWRHVVTCRLRVERVEVEQ